MMSTQRLATTLFLISSLTSCNIAKISKLWWRSDSSRPAPATSQTSNDLKPTGNNIDNTSDMEDNGEFFYKYNSEKELRPVKKNKFTTAGSSSKKKKRYSSDSKASATNSDSDTGSQSEEEKDNEKSGDEDDNYSFQTAKTIRIDNSKKRKKKLVDPSFDSIDFGSSSSWGHALDMAEIAKQASIQLNAAYTPACKTLQQLKKETTVLDILIKKEKTALEKKVDEKVNTNTVVLQSIQEKIQIKYKELQKLKQDLEQQNAKLEEVTTVFEQEKYEFFDAQNCYNGKILNNASVGTLEVSKQNVRKEYSEAKFWATQKHKIEKLSKDIATAIKKLEASIAGDEFLQKYAASQLEQSKKEQETTKKVIQGSKKMIKNLQQYNQQQNDTDDQSTTTNAKSALKKRKNKLHQVKLTLTDDVFKALLSSSSSSLGHTRDTTTKMEEVTEQIKRQITDMDSCYGRTCTLLQNVEKKQKEIDSLVGKKTLEKTNEKIKDDQKKISNIEETLQNKYNELQKLHEQLKEEEEELERITKIADSEWMGIQEIRTQLKYTSFKYDHRKVKQLTKQLPQQEKKAEKWKEEKIRQMDLLEKVKQSITQIKTSIATTQFAGRLAINNLNQNKKDASILKSVQKEVSNFTNNLKSNGKESLFSSKKEKK